MNVGMCVHVRACACVCVCVCVRGVQETRAALMRKTAVFFLAPPTKVSKPMQSCFKIHKKQGNQGSLSARDFVIIENVTKKSGKVPWESICLNYGLTLASLCTS